MALKGIDIFKLSPKTNCRECGSATCMAFCMKVAQGALPLTQCPFFSDEGRAAVAAASEPPMKTVTVGENIVLGGETVLLRHEKTFVSPTCFAVALSTDMDDNTVAARLKELKAVDYERIGEREYTELVSVRCETATAARWEPLVMAAMQSGRALLLDCEDVSCAEKVLQLCADKKPILNGAAAENFLQMNELAQRYDVALGVRAEQLSELYDIVKALEAAGNRNLLLDLTAETAKESFANAVQTRRSAIADGEHRLGYPSIVNLARLAKGDLRLQTALAAVLTLRYGSILVMEQVDYAEALPLFGLRQNLFTDPQKPMTVTPGLYPMNGATPDDVCMLTVDFALTYFLVSGEIERSGVPINLLIADASGMSVLTAWAAGKLSGSSVKRFFDEQRLAERLRTRTVLIPGKVAVLQSEIAEKLPDWNIGVGTKEAVEIVKFLKNGEHLKAAAAVKKTAVQTVEETDFTRIVLPEIVKKDMGVQYRPREKQTKKFTVIGERIHCISPVIREAMAHFDPAPILQRAAEQLAAGATYLDVNIGPAETGGAALMMWVVRLLQENFDNVPLALDTVNRRAIEAGISVYNRAHGKPIINSADAGSRIKNVDIAAENDAIIVALCAENGLPRDNDERMAHCHTLLERGLSRGMDAADLWFDPLFLVVKGMQEKIPELLQAIRRFSDEGLHSTGGLSNCSNGMPKAVRPIMDATLLAMAITQGLTSAIVNPCSPRLMETVKTADILQNHTLYSDSYLEL